MSDEDLEAIESSKIKQITSKEYAKQIEDPVDQDEKNLEFFKIISQEEKKYIH